VVSRYGAPDDRNGRTDCELPACPAFRLHSLPACRAGVALMPADRAISRCIASRRRDVDQGAGMVELRFRVIVQIAVAMLVPATAAAALKDVAADGFLVEHRYSIAASPLQAWQVLVHPERYWPDDHTWSGSRAHLSLRAEAQGCFCEQWDKGSVEHGRVVMAIPGKVLRIRGALGPLQELALTGVLTISLQGTDTGTDAVVTYRVSGDSLHQLETFAPVVDQVIGLQLGAFAELASAK